jgi:hypothetical protein
VEEKIWCSRHGMKMQEILHKYLARTKDSACNNNSGRSRLRWEDERRAKEEGEKGKREGFLAIRH